MIKKPLSHKIYDYTNGGIDISDQRMGSYNTNYKMACINSQAIDVINNAKEDASSFEFGWKLMKALKKPNIHTRLGRGGLSKRQSRSAPSK